ncbi:MAG TPA: SDR family oxidoreductase [Opitutaceae bacterium]|nr:SDR family oxidoreductase [Opitutaceae bacterium]
MNPNLLENKSIIVHSAAGAVGSAVARAFAQQGAQLFLTSRESSWGKLKTLADELRRSGSVAELAAVDTLDETSVEQHAESVAAKTGRIEVVFNAIGIPQIGIQGLSLLELPVEQFMRPAETYLKSHYITSRAAIRRMLPAKSGVILLHTPEPARVGAPLIGGMGPMWAGLEAFARDLSAEFGAQGIRAVCLRTTGLPETETITTVFGLHAKAIGVAREQFQSIMESMSHHRRSTTLKELSSAATFAASDLGAGLFGTVLNLTAGKCAD